eukprot:6190802-Pleurochrysis_carterae.AAC.1
MHACVNLTANYGKGECAGRANSERNLVATRQRVIKGAQTRHQGCSDASSRQSVRRGAWWNSMTAQRVEEGEGSRAGRRIRSGSSGGRAWLTQGSRTEGGGGCCS